MIAEDYMCWKDAISLNFRGGYLSDCSTPYCRNEAAPDRTICWKCKSRKWAKSKPFSYHHNALRNNARRRGIEFELTLEEFKELWRAHPRKWAEKKKWGKETKWQMDRIDPTKGYTADNIQILTKRKNIMKWIQHDRFHMEVDWQPVGESSINEEAPF